jgi:hypothetical protein
MLQEIRDTNNNYVRYVYAKDSGQIYPQKIYYTGNGSTDGIFAITFSTTTRPDTYISYKPLFKVTTNYRISMITAAVNGTTVREYDLSYGSGNNGVRSLLSSVQQKGWDQNGQNGVTLPAMTFSYANTSTWFVGPSGVKNGSYVIADINGDSLNDWTEAYVPFLPSSPSAFSNSGSLPTPPGYWGFQESSCLSYRPAELGLRLVDVNADGKADYIQGSNISGVANVGAWINTYTATSGYSWNGTATGTIPYFALDGGVTTGLLSDVNGDGLPDYELASGGTDQSYLGNGALWDAATTTIFAPAKEFPNGTPTVTNSQLVDINGDGLPDWVYSDSSNTYVLLNTGTGWATTTASQWTIATSTLYLVPGSSPAKYYDRGMRFVDVNGDGLVDFVRAFKNSTSTGNSNDEAGDYTLELLNTGNGWATTTWAGTSYITQGDSVSSLGQCYSEIANWTGNGQNAQDVLTTITYPQGGSASISYAKSAQGSNPELPISLLTVTNITTNDGFGNTAGKTYTYSGGKMYSALGVRDQKFAGFSTVTETDANTKTTTYYDQGDSIDTADGEQNDGYGQIGHSFRVDTTDLASGKVLKTVFNRWDTSPIFAGKVTFVYLARQLEEDFDPTGAHRDVATDYTYDRTTGNATQITHYGEVSGNSSGTFADMGTDKSVETLSYIGQSGVQTSSSSTVQTFASSTTWTAPTGASSVTVDMWGGGGGASGGAQANVGGASGSYVHQTVTVTPGHVYTLTVGTGGGGGVGSGAGGAGGTGYKT